VAGLQGNDVILKVDGVDIRNENQLINLFAALPIGQRVKMQVWRDRRPTTIEGGSFARYAFTYTGASTVTSQPS